jgi:hypothetical protein
MMAVNPARAESTRCFASVRALTNANSTPQIAFSSVRLDAVTP